MNKYLSITIGLSSLLIGVSAAHSTTISFLDTTETLQVSIDGNICLPLGTPGASCTTGLISAGADFSIIGEQIVSRLFTSVFPFANGNVGKSAVVFKEPVSGVFSDIVEAEVFAIAPGVQQTFFTFGSGSTTPSQQDFVNALIGRFGITETGAGQDVTKKFRDITGALKSIPSDLTVIVFSDACEVDPRRIQSQDINICRVPEPSSTLSLLSLGTLGAASTLKRKLKPSKSSEKETTKVS